MQGEQLFALAAKVAPLIREGRFRFNRVRSEEEGKGYDGTPFAAVLTNDQNQNERLYMRADWHAKGRVAINGMYPEGANRDERWTHFRGVRITVAASRSAHGIAADIGRRLIPLYRQRLGEAVANIDARKGEANHLANQLHLLGLQCTKPLEPWKAWSQHIEKWSFNTNLTSGTIERRYDRDWEVTVRLAYADAVRLLAWLNAHPPAPREEGGEDE